MAPDRQTIPVWCRNRQQYGLVLPAPSALSCGPPASENRMIDPSIPASILARTAARCPDRVIAMCPALAGVRPAPQGFSLYCGAAADRIAASRAACFAAQVAMVIAAPGQGALLAAGLPAGLPEVGQISLCPRPPCNAPPALARPRPRRRCCASRAVRTIRRLARCRAATSSLLHNDMPRCPGAPR